jgi:multidrug resistance efflux pump
MAFMCMGPRKRWTFRMSTQEKRILNTGIEASKYSTVGRSAAGGPNRPVSQTGGDQLPDLDVQAQSALLKETFNSPNPFELDAPILTPPDKPHGLLVRWAWRAFKSVLALAIIVVAGVGPVQRMLRLSSVEAVVNARLVSVRAPVDGKIDETDLAPTIGAEVPKGGFVLRISNSRADRTRLDDLRRLILQIESERPAVVNRLARLRELHEQISQQARAFRSGRIRELEERTMDLKAQVAAAEAAELEAASTLERTKELAASGVQTKVAIERAERDAKVASETQKSLNHRLFSSEVELEAVRRGEYVGDTYNDRPSSLQQADELSIRIAESEAELMSRDQRLAKLRAELDGETARYFELSNATLTSPIDARIWEVLVSPGEEVRKGQDLLRLLDCSGAIITVTVREFVFNQLRIGDKALFRFSGQSGKHEGTIVRMSGMAAPPDNLAVQPSALASGGFRITVSVPDLALTQCPVGRTGSVSFNASTDSGGILQPLENAISFFLPGS